MEKAKSHSEVQGPRRVRLLPVILTGLYSFGLTVLPVVSETGVSSLSAAAAGCALLCLFASPLLPPGRWSMVSALDGFVGFCILSWWGARNVHLEPPFPIFGSLGWVAFTLALGSVSSPAEEGSGGVQPGQELRPRTPPSRLAAVLLIVVFLVALYLLGRAWAVERPAMAVLSHVFVLGTVLLLLRASAHLANHLQASGSKLTASPSLGRARVPLLGLLVFILGGIWLRFFPG